MRSGGEDFKEIAWDGEVVLMNTNNAWEYLPIRFLSAPLSEIVSLLLYLVAVFLNDDDFDDMDDWLIVECVKGVRNQEHKSRGRDFIECVSYRCKEEGCWGERAMEADEFGVFWTRSRSGRRGTTCLIDAFNAFIEMITAEIYCPFWVFNYTPYSFSLLVSYQSQPS